MLPIGLLMKEHRLIERMIKQMENEALRISRDELPKAEFINTAVDFIQIYADKCHHGKEEDILFRDLDKKDISSEHRSLMEQLIQEHVWGRETVAKLIEAKDMYINGEMNAKDDILAEMNKLIDFYPKHIDKEDNHFFKPCMDYFTDQEKETMLKECFDFDRELIHEKYESIVENLEDA